MNNTAEQLPDYEPVRASVKSERDRLLYDIAELEKKLAVAQAKSETGVDPSYMRLEYTLGKQLDTARERLSTFDRKHQALDAARDSDAAKVAADTALKAARKFEKTLTAFASATTELNDAGGKLAAVVQEHDPGIWPSRQTVDTAVRGRIIEVLGSRAGIKLGGYGSSCGKQSAPLTERFQETR